VRCLSTTPGEPREFIRQRSEYQKEMTDLRKAWAVEIAQKRALEAREKALEKEKIVLAKAVRLREKRKESVIRQEADKKAKQMAYTKYLAHLEQNLVVHCQRLEEQTKINALYDHDVEEESSTWITEANMDSKITTALFEKPASTGLLTRESELWRWQLHSMKIDRLMNHSAETSSDFAGSSLAERLEFRGQIRSARKIMVQDFLEPMIESGADRQGYDELVEKFTSKFEDLDAWHKADEVDDFFFDDDNNISAFLGGGAGAGAEDGGASASAAKVEEEEEEEEEATEAPKVKRGGDPRKKTGGQQPQGKGGKGKR
jgi:hypothetical protein